MIRLEHTGYPIGALQTVPESDWKLLSTHRTLSAAQKRMLREKQRCQRQNGLNTWDDHYRIVY